MDWRRPSLMASNSLFSEEGPGGAVTGAGSAEADMGEGEEVVDAGEVTGVDEEVVAGF